MTSTVTISSTPGRTLKTYDEYKAIGMGFRKDSDKNDWDLGDLVVDVVYLAEISKKKVIDLQSEGETPTPDLIAVAAEKNIVNKFADDIGWKHDHVIARKRVAERFGKHHWLRTSSLSFSHARILYPIADEPTLDLWAKRAIEEKISVHELSDLLREEREKQKAAAGEYTCETCRETINDVDVMVTSKQHKSKFYFCNWNCNGQFAYKMAGTTVPDIDQDLELDSSLIEDDDDDAVLELAEF